MSVKTQKMQKTIYYIFILVHQGFLSLFVLFTPKKWSPGRQTSNFSNFRGGLQKKRGLLVSEIGGIDKR